MDPLTRSPQQIKLHNYHQQQLALKGKSKIEDEGKWSERSPYSPMTSRKRKRAHQYDSLKENGFAPFPRRHIQKFARQLSGSVTCKLDVFKSSAPSSHVSCLVLHDLPSTDLKHTTGSQ